MVLALTNNDILRRLRYAFDFNDDRMMSLFARAELPATRREVSAWLKRDEDPAFEAIDDEHLAAFLNGLILMCRGSKEDKPPVNEQRLNNNLVLRKLKIALELKDTDMVELLAMADMTVSKAELSALFRRPEHKHFRKCQDQLLRRFLRGVEISYRETQEGEEAP